MSALTDTQKRNVAILRSQGDTDEQIAANLRVPLSAVKRRGAAQAEPTTTDPSLLTD